MKFKTLFFGIFCTTLALAGCDVITNPIKPQQVNGTLPSTAPYSTNSSAPISTSNSYTNYKVLVEDYMGHTCSNCPPAVAEGEQLLTSYPGQVVIMEVHQGHYADTVTIAGVPDSAFRKDYTSTAGNNWGKIFAVNQWPWGMINRIGHPNNYFIYYLNWSNTVQAQINQNPTALVTINIHDSCWINPRIIGAEFQITFKEAQDTACVFEAVILQDSILDWQEDANSSSGYDTNFVHHNVLRGAFDIAGNGTAIPTTASTAINGTWTSYQTYNFTTGENGKAAGWNMAKCYIMAFVYNQISNRVLQVEEIKVE